MVKLYFVNSENEETFITSIEDRKEGSKSIFKEINKFIKEKNPNYKIYYIRQWEEGNKTWYDVGSHSEFFFTVGIGEESNYVYNRKQ